MYQLNQLSNVHPRKITQNTAHWINIICRNTDSKQRVE